MAISKIKCSKLKNDALCRGFRYHKEVYKKDIQNESIKEEFKFQLGEVVDLLDMYREDTVRQVKIIKSKPS